MDRRCDREEGGGGQYERAYAGVLAINRKEIALEGDGDPSPSREMSVMIDDLCSMPAIEDRRSKKKKRLRGSFLFLAFFSVAWPSVT